MKTWRGIIGLILPADSYLDADYWKLVPPGISVFTTRIMSPKEISLESVMELSESDDIEQAAKILSISRPQAIGFACTSGSFVKGLGYDKMIIRRMEKGSAGIPATTTSTAVLEAFRELKIEKVAILTPYIQEINRKLNEFLEDAGFHVVKMCGLEMRLSRQLAQLSEYETYRLAKECNIPEADGIFIACTNFPTLDTIESLEQDLCKPVISANQATMWKLLRMIEVKASIEHCGELMKKV